MKYNRSQFFALHNMRKRTDNTEMRPEQKNIIRIIKRYCTKGVHWYLEPEMRCMFLYDDMGLMSVHKQPKLDIYISTRSSYKTPIRMIAIRVMGPYHDREPQEKYDSWQKELLQSNGYIVKDLWYFSMPYIWESKPPTERHQYDEVVTELSDILDFSEYESRH